MFCGCPFLKNAGEPFNELEKILTKGKPIGEGIQATAYLLSGCDGKLDVQYVVKRYHDLKDRQSQTDYVQELNMMLEVNHPAVVPVIEFNLLGWKGDGVPYMMLPFYQKGSLASISGWNKDWTNTKKLINMIGIASGMKHLHKNGIVHRDLKPDNILLDEYYYPNISDFGRALRIPPSGKIMMNRGTTNTTCNIYAPEYVTQNHFDAKVDVYAFGILMYWIFTRQEVNNYGSDEIHKVCDGIDADLSMIPAGFRDLITACWDVDPTKRPDFKQIVRTLTKVELWKELENVHINEVITYIIMIQELDDDQYHMVTNPFAAKGKELVFGDKLSVLRGIDNDCSGRIEYDEMARFLFAEYPNIFPFTNIIMLAFGEKIPEGGLAIRASRYKELYECFNSATGLSKLSQLIFEKLDEDKNEVLSFEEVQAFVRRVQGPRDLVAKLVRKVKRMDVNKFARLFQAIVCFVSLWVEKYGLNGATDTVWLQNGDLTVDE